MEEKKFDLNSIIGFVLIGAIFIWMLYLQQPTEEEIAAQVNLAKEGLSGVTNEDWAALASLDSESRNSIIEKCESIAQADSEYSDKEREVVSVLRAKLGV